MMLTSSAKAKGRKLQNWACERFAKILGVPWGRDELIRPREMGQSGSDVSFLGYTKELVPFDYVECKNHQSWAVPAWVKERRKHDKDWILFVGKNHFEPIVVLDAKYFFYLFGKYIHPRLKRKQEMKGKV